jgi:hypothetical protein
MSVGSIATPNAAPLTSSSIGVENSVLQDQNESLPVEYELPTPLSSSSRVEDDVEVRQLGGVDDAVDVMDTSSAQGEGECAEDTAVA